MAQLGPALPVDGPIPAPPVYSLVGAALTGETVNGHWEAGLALRPYPCNPGQVWDPCSSGGSRTKTETGATHIAASADYNPFVVVKAVECSTRQGLRDHRERVVAAFNSLRHWSIEREFWEGNVISGNPHLAGPTTTTIATGVGLKTAMAYLDESIGDTSQRGMIHAPKFVASQWVANQVVRDVGGQLRSPMGNIVVSGGGYSNLGPAGTDPNGTSPVITKSWVYATGPVQVYASEVYVTPDDEASAVNRSANTIAYRAEQTVAVLWDQCLHVAVQVNLDSAT